MPYKFIVYALSLEFGSAALLMARDNGIGLTVAYLVLHGAASGIGALALALIMPKRYRTPRRWLLAYLFAFLFFVPVAGAACAAGGMLVSALLPRARRSGLFDVTDVPRFTTHRNHEGTGFRGGQVRAQLGNRNTPIDQRLKALVAVQDTPARATGKLLRELLADRVDDIRLLAYGILDNKEKQIAQRIQENRQKLDALQRTGREDEGAKLHKSIAELYWELIYQNLVQGDMQTFAASQVRRHLDAAIALHAADAGLWFLLARLELHQQSVAAAEHALQQAQRAGFARERLLPYLAELRFLQRRFGEVRRLFTELEHHPGLPALAATRRYWQSPSGAAALPRPQAAKPDWPQERAS